MSGFIWKPKADAGAGEYVRVADGAAGGASGARPRVEGASSSKAPASSATPCPLGTIRITVRRANGGAGIRGAEVSVGPIDVRPTDKSGAVAFEKVSPGDYTIAVDLPAANPPAFLRPPPCSVTLNASSTASVTIEVEPLATLRVNVADETTGAGIAGARVSIATAAGTDPADGVSDGKGTAVLAGIRGRPYRVTISFEGDTARRYRAPAALDVDLKPGDTVTRDVKVGPLGIQPVKLVRKSAKGGSPAPIENATVTLAGGGAELTAVTDADGIARLAGIVPGDFALALDLGAESGRYRPYAGETVTVKGGVNADKTIELEVLHCHFASLRITEYLAQAEKSGTGGARTFKEKAGRVFVLGGPGGGKDIVLGARQPVTLVAPRKSDLLKDPAAPLSPLPFNPPVGELQTETKPTWLEIQLDAQAHAVAPEPTPGHPLVVVQSGSGDKVVDVKGAAKTGRFLVFGPDVPCKIDDASASGRWFKRLGLELGEIMSAATARSGAPRTWDAFVDVCDEDGHPVRHQVPLVVYPGDEYELAVNIPPVYGIALGANGDYIKGATTTQREQKTLGQTFDAKTETTSPSGVEREVTTPSDTTKTAADGTVTVSGSKFFTAASIAKPIFETDPVFDLKRNGKRDPATAKLVDLGNLILWCSTEAAEWFTPSNLTPKWGWWVTLDLSLLAISLKSSWGWQPSKTANDVVWAYKTELGGTLLAVKLGVKAGLEGTVVPRVVYFRAVLYLELSGTADAQIAWSSEESRKQNVSTTIALEIGVDLVIGNANFCQAKAWVKAPYTFQWNFVPPPATAGPGTKWTTDFKSGCKDGVYMVAKYCLFYGKYKGTTRVELREKVPLD